MERRKPEADLSKLERGEAQGHMKATPPAWLICLLKGAFFPLPRPTGVF